MNHQTLTRSLIAAGAMLVGTSAFALDIDNFNDVSAQLVVSPTIGMLTSDDTSPTGNAIGGFRQLTASGGTGILGTVGKVEDDAFSYANSPSSVGSMSIIYDADSAGLGGIDLTDGNTSTGIIFSILYSDLPTSSTITIEGGGTSTATATLPSGILLPGDAQDFFVSFADFVGAADLTNITSIQFDFEPATTGIAGNDLILDNISTGVVPEPSSLALIALGGLAMMRRRSA